MIARRRFLIGAGLLAGGAGRLVPGVPGNDDLHFDVARNGSHIGTHVVRFSRQGDVLTVNIDAEFRVGFGPITFFRYHHSGIETWKAGQFVSLHTRTDDNGTQRQVSAVRQANGILIRGSDVPDRLALPDTLPLTHWAIAAMSAPVFNPETGKELAEQARHLGASTVSLADGKQIPATRFALTGEAQITDWYDESRVWAALQAQAKDGSVINYKRIA
jgi:hypothetical protein